MPYPWDFLSLIPSNVIGEMWVGVTSAIVVDLSPARIRTSAIATYLFIITIIGGNFNVLVTAIKNALPGDSKDLNKARWALFFTFPLLYAISSLLFLATFFLMRLDLHIKKRTEEWSMNIIGRTTPDKEE